MVESVVAEQLECLPEWWDDAGVKTAGKSSDLVSQRALESFALLVSKRRI